MPHSYAETLTLTCAACGRDFDAEFWLVVDTAERPDLIERIRAGGLHEMACPHCGDAGHMDAPLLLDGLTEVAAHLAYDRMRGDPATREFAHPIWWAAFTMTGA